MRGRRLRIMFVDEARFGRMNRIRPCWAPVGMRPDVAAQLIREYIYLYGAVSPKDGTCVYLIMPTSNTACFQAFLEVVARRFARQDILLVSELDARSLTPQVVGDTLVALLKYQDDIARMQGDALNKVLKEATSEI